MALLTYNQQQAIKPISANNERRYLQLQKDVEDVELPRLLGFKLAQLVQDNPLNHVDLLDGSAFDYCGYQLNQYLPLFIGKINFEGEEIFLNLDLEEDKVAIYSICEKCYKHGIYIGCDMLDYFDEDYMIL